MVSLSTELEKLNLLLLDIEKIEKLISLSDNANNKQKLEFQKQEILFQIKEMYLERRLKKEGLNESIIKEFAALESSRRLLTQPKFEIESNKYNLSSEFIVSNKTGETINVKDMNIADKIKKIYMHTGEIISYQDSILLNSCDECCASFVERLAHTFPKGELIDKYGQKWQEEVERLYKQGFNDSIKHHIDKIVNEIDYTTKQKNTSDNKDSAQGENEIKKENEFLKSELGNAHLKIEQLVQQISEMQKDNKDDLQEYRDALASAVQKNAKDTNSFEYTPEEKLKILGALGIQFEHDETKRNGVGIDNDYKLAIFMGTPIEQTARQMMICKNLGIRVSATFNEKELHNTSFENEQQVVGTYCSMVEQHKKYNSL